MENDADPSMERMSAKRNPERDTFDGTMAKVEFKSLAMRITYVSSNVSSHLSY